MDEPRLLPLLERTAPTHLEDPSELLALAGFQIGMIHSGVIPVDLVQRMQYAWTSLVVLSLSAASLQEPPSEEPQRIQGTVTLVLDDGTRRAPKDGELLLTIQCAGTVCERKVVLKDGAWVYDLDAGDRFFAVACMQLEGSHAYRSDDPGGVWPCEPRNVAFEARWLPSTRIVATDRQGEPIDKIQFVAGNADFWHHVDIGDPRYSADGARWSEPVASPITIEPIACGPEALQFMAPGLNPWSPRSFCVRAEGYALSDVQVDPTIGGDVRVILAPAATLELTISREDDLSRELRVELIPRFSSTTGMLTLRNLPFRSSGAEQGMPLPSGPQRNAAHFQRIERLEAGDWTARLSWLRPVTEQTSRILYGEAVDFQLVPGETRGVELRFKDPDAGQPVGVPLVGEIAVPSGWATEQGKVEIVLSRQQLGSSTFEVEHRVVPGSLEATITPGIWRFDAGTVQPGRWHAYVLPFRSLQLFEVPESGGQVALSVPEPVDVVLKIQGLEVDSLSWRPALPDRSGPVRGATLATVRASKDGAFRFRATIGSIEVLAGVRPEVLELRPGTSEYELTLRPLATLQVELFDGDVPVAFPEPSVAAWLEGDDGRRIDAYSRAYKGGSLAHWLGFEVEGAYRLRISVPIGYRDPGSIEVELAAGEERKVVVPLEPTSR